MNSVLWHGKILKKNILWKFHFLISTFYSRLIGFWQGQMEKLWIWLEIGQKTDTKITEIRKNVILFSKTALEYSSPSNWCKYYDINTLYAFLAWFSGVWTLNIPLFWLYSEVQSQSPPIFFQYILISFQKCYFWEKWNLIKIN